MADLYRKRPTDPDPDPVTDTVDQPLQTKQVSQTSSLQCKQDTTLLHREMILYFDRSTDLQVDCPVMINPMTSQFIRILI